MPTFTSDPPKEPRGPALPIKRTPAFKPLQAIVTCEDLVGCYTHFYQGHTVPCESPNCDACADGIPFRWHAYLSAVDYQNGLHFLFECTAQAAEHFVAYRDSNHGLRGCLFQATRLNRRPNGRVLITTKPTNLTERMLPKAPDLKACLAILWSMPSGSLSDNSHNPNKKQRQIKRDAPRDETFDPSTPERILDP